MACIKWTDDQLIIHSSSDLSCIIMTYVMLLLLLSQELLKILTKLMTVCLYFSESMKKFARTKGVCELDTCCSAV